MRLPRRGCLVGLVGSSGGRSIGIGGVGGNIVLCCCTLGSFGGVGVSTLRRLSGVGTITIGLFVGVVTSTRGCDGGSICNGVR